MRRVAGEDGRVKVGWGRWGAGKRLTVVGRASRRRVDCWSQVWESLKYTIVGEGSGEGCLRGLVVKIVAAARCR